ncbi:Swt1 family HEPN domain-containing protein [Streptomyces sp. NPDC054765]
MYDEQQGAQDAADRTTKDDTDRMALSNRDRIGRMIELLPEGVLPLVEREMTRRQGNSWFDDAVAAARSGGLGAQSKEDPHFLLTTVLRNWASYFRHVLPPAARSYVGELSDVRNRWAHNAPFSADDTSRALDTAERLLTDVGAPGELVAKVRTSRLEHQRILIEAETKKATRRAADMPAVAAEGGLKPWRDVLVPHQDVAQGKFNASEYAANLAHVVNGDGAPEYTDPEEFFHRTYLTDGLQQLLEKSLRRLSGDNSAAPIVNLQTNFGGGKTHSMLALYHLFSPGLRPQRLPQEMQELIAEAPGGTLPTTPVTRAVIVGTELSPGAPDSKPDGTRVSTLWGELGWQLGGKEGYGLVAEADRSRTSPGSAVLQDLLAAYAPCLILIDEWVVYARQLVNNNDLPAGDFDTHFSFAQSLTEAVAAVEGAQLILSIPASDTGKGNDADDNEIGGPAGQIALERLQNVVRRNADPWRPASADESFEIVRRRLFEAPTGTAQAQINKVARVFQQFYANHKAEFPSGSDSTEYERLIRATYPIHPELFARLYEDWSTLERFQRTRGVLRLMSAVIHALWIGQSQSPMIMVGDIPLNDRLVSSDLTQYLEDRWKAILDTDVDGVHSTPVEIDKEKSYLGQRAVSRRIARTVFMGSAATLKAAKKGLSEAHVRLGMAIPGDTMGNFRTALNTLADRSTYLYADADRYWYDTQANITRLAKDEANRLLGRQEDIWAEIVRRLSPMAQRRADFKAVHAAPRSTRDIPDRDEARLVLLHPQYTHTKDRDDTPAMEFVAEALLTHGPSQRSHRNMLVFLAPDKRRMQELEEAVGEFLGWRKVLADHLQHDLSESQRRQAEARMAQAAEKVELRIGQTYHWALVPQQGEEPGARLTWEDIKIDTGSAEDLAARTAERLKRKAQLHLQQAPNLIQQKLTGPLSRIWEAEGHLSVGRLWELHTTYPYLNRLVGRSVLDAGVEDVLSLFNWEQEGFALATGYEEAEGHYQGLVLPGGNTRFSQITDSTLLVRPERALAQRRQEEEEITRRREATAHAATNGGGTGTTARARVEEEESGEARGERGQGQGKENPSTVGPGISVQPTLPRTLNRFYATARLTPEQYSKNATDYVFEILQHLALSGTEVEVTVEIQASRPEGFPEDKVRILRENSNTLNLQAEFESD